MTTNLQVLLKELPLDEVVEAHFELRETLIPPVAKGEALVRHHFLSLDPWMRRRMAQAVAGEAKMAPGDCMAGRTVGEVVASRAAGLKEGDVVLGWGGWQAYSVAAARSLEKLPQVSGYPLSVHLGILGRPGITAWLGLVDVARVKRGDSVVVSSAGGAVGSIAAQIALHIGGRVTGIAGGTAKCAAVVSDLGLHACVDHRSADLEQALREAMPEGVDVCFENVGGAVLDASLANLNEGGRIALCGMTSQYHSGPGYGFRNFGRFLDRSLKMSGFHIDAQAHLFDRARDELRTWLDAGVVRGWETVRQGIEQAPAAFVAMLAGEGRGKTLVQLV